VVVVDREKKTCNIIDIAVPVDAGIVEKEKEKVEKYQDLRREVLRLWNVKAKVVPIVVGALGAVTPNFSKHLPFQTPGCNWCDHKDRAFTESSSPRHSAPPQTSTKGLRL